MNAPPLFPRKRGRRRAKAGRLAATFLVVCLTALLPACRSSHPAHPPLPESREQAAAALEAMRTDPAPALRPLVLVGGWGDPVWGMKPVRKRLHGLFEGSLSLPVIVQNHFLFGSFENNRRRLIAAVDEAFPSNAPGHNGPSHTGSNQTVPVDVIAHSMGGLLARYAAMPVDRHGAPARRLNVRRLYTIATPHRGARLAFLSPLEAPARDMKPGSEFLALLDAAAPEATYELHTYARTRDGVVGWPNAAPVGHTLHWVDSPWWQRGHSDAKKDPRILADIARRLRAPD